MDRSVVVHTVIYSPCMYTYLYACIILFVYKQKWSDRFDSPPPTDLSKRACARAVPYTTSIVRYRVRRRRRSENETSQTSRYVYIYYILVVIRFILASISIDVENIYRYFSHFTVLISVFCGPNANTTLIPLQSV